MTEKDPAEVRRDLFGGSLYYSMQKGKFLFWPERTTQGSFIPDAKKAGGRYVTASGHVKVMDGAEHVIIMADGAKIPIEDVRYIEGDLFRLFG